MKQIESRSKNGRSDRIRTYDPLVPNEVRYQTALHSDIVLAAPSLVGTPPSLSAVGAVTQAVNSCRGAACGIEARRTILVIARGRIKPDVPGGQMLATLQPGRQA